MRFNFKMAFATLLALGMLLSLMPAMTHACAECAGDTVDITGSAATNIQDSIQDAINGASPGGVTVTGSKTNEELWTSVTGNGKDAGPQE